MGVLGQRADRAGRRRTRATAGARKPRRGRPPLFDFGGAFSVTAGLSVLVYALVKAPDHGWGSAHTLGLIAVAAALIAVFVFIERRSIAPLVPFEIFRIRTLTGANVVGILTGAALFSMFFFVALYMRSVLGYSAIKTGVSYLPLAVSIILSAGIASQLVTRIGFKPVMMTGLGLSRRSPRRRRPETPDRPDLPRATRTPSWSAPASRYWAYWRRQS